MQKNVFLKYVCIKLFIEHSTICVIPEYILDALISVLETLLRFSKETDMTNSPTGCAY